MATPIKPPQKHGAPAQLEPIEDKGRHATDELADACATLEVEVEELKVKYEMYFLGVERNEPIRLREDLKKRVLRLKERFTRNAGIRFRVQSLHARFISYERLWLRSAREKEEGTYRRDVFKARRSASQRAATAPGKRAILRFSQAEDVDLTDFGDEEASAPAVKLAASPAASPAAPARAAPGPAAPAPMPARPATPAPPPASLPAPAARPAAAARSAAAAAPAVDARTQALYAAYVAARKSCNQDLAGITPDAIARTIAKQTPEIMLKHKARSVEFKVEVKNGRAILKAVPKT